MASIKNVDISSPAFKANPYPFYAQLRDEAPVHRITLRDKRPAWLVTRYDDVVTVLKDDRFVKDKRSVFTPEQMAREPWIPRMLKPIERNMLDADAPEHTRLRGLVHKAFTPRLIENMRERIQRLTDELLDRGASTGTHGPDSRLRAAAADDDHRRDAGCTSCRTAISSTAGRTRSCRPCRPSGECSRPSRP